MLVHLGVPLALFAADLAGLDTGLELLADELNVGLRQPGEDVTGGHADSGAVEVQTDAPNEILDGLFAQARVGTGVAALSAIVASLDALLEPGQAGGRSAWVGAEHLRDMGHVRLPRLVATQKRLAR